MKITVKTIGAKNAVEIELEPTDSVIYSQIRKFI